MKKQKPKQKPKVSIVSLSDNLGIGLKINK